MSDKKEPRCIMDAHPEHYGKWVLIRSFNDNMIVAYGSTIDAMQEDAKSKGFKVVGHRDDSEEERNKVGVSMYCQTPCESQVGISTIVNGEMVDSGCNVCPVCKHRKDE